MSSVLTTDLDVKEVETDTFVSVNKVHQYYWNTVLNNVFGGFLLAQTVEVAYRTVRENHTLLAMHYVFVAGPVPDVPLKYVVKRLSDGKSTSYREVQVFQNGAYMGVLFLLFGDKRLKKRLVIHPDIFSVVPKNVAKTIDHFPFKDDGTVDSSIIETQYAHNPQYFDPNRGAPFDCFFLAKNMAAPIFDLATSSTPIHERVVFFAVRDKLPLTESPNGGLTKEEKYRVFLTYILDTSLMQMAVTILGISAEQIKRMASMSCSVTYNSTKLEADSTKWHVLVNKMVKYQDGRATMCSYIFDSLGTFVAYCSQDGLVLLKL